MTPLWDRPHEQHAHRSKSTQQPKGDCDDAQSAPVAAAKSASKSTQQPKGDCDYLAMMLTCALVKSSKSTQQPKGDCDSGVPKPTRIDSSICRNRLNSRKAIVTRLFEDGVVSHEPRRNRLNSRKAIVTRPFLQADAFFYTDVEIDSTAERRL